MLKLKFTLTLLLLSTIAFGQKSVEGDIKDRSTDMLIPYCPVFIENTSVGTIANSSGHFELDIPDSLTLSNLVVRTLGYETYTTSIAEITGTSQIVYLLPKVSGLPEFEISANREKKLKPKNVGSRKKKNEGFYAFKYGYEVALFFNNEKAYKGYISKVRFFITSRGFPDTPFRVKIYSVDKKTDGPGKEISDKSIIGSAVSGNQWVVIDVLNQGIKIPKRGFFVAMEWLPVADEKEYSPDSVSTKAVLGGQALGATNEFGMHGLTWFKSFLRPWAVPIISPESINVINAKIGAELMIYKKKYRDEDDDSE